MAEQPPIIIDHKNIRLLSSDLKKIRTDKEVTQEQMAKKLKIKQANVSYLENKPTGPSLLPLLKYLDQLDYQLIIVPKK